MIIITHAPLARGDRHIRKIEMLLTQISIHAPLARGDYKNKHLTLCTLHFNPRPSREGRRGKGGLDHRTIDISIHAPLARGDCKRTTSSATLPIFQSTPLSRGATQMFEPSEQEIRISIHAPLARGDKSPHRRPARRIYFNPRPSREGRLFGRSSTGVIGADFNPRPSREGRHNLWGENSTHFEFQSTPLSRGATCCRWTAR